MSEEAEKEKLVTLGVKINQNTRDRWDELKADGAFDTGGQFLDALLERYANPLKINKDNEEAVKQLKENVRSMQLTIDKLTADLQTANEGNQKQKETLAQNADLIQELSEKLKASGDAFESASHRNKEYEQRMKGCIVVPAEPLDILCLQYLADRENKNRKRNDITPEVFFMYCVREMLIKGNKFSIDCVPDSVVKKLQQQLKAKEE